MISCTQKHWRLICLTVFWGKKWRTTSTFNCLNNFEMTYFKSLKKKEIDTERAVKQITLARGGANAPSLWPTSGALPMLASRPLHVLTALPIFHIGGLLAQKSRSVLCRGGASQHRERYRCWPEGGALAPPPWPRRFA